MASCWSRQERRSIRSIQCRSEQALLFIDARDTAQVKRASGILDERGGKLKVILTGGSYLDLMRRWKRPVFFDQQGTLTEKLGIRHVPALVTQDGKEAEDRGDSGMSPCKRLVAVLLLSPALPGRPGGGRTDLPGPLHEPHHRHLLELCFPAHDRLGVPLVRRAK
jgi:hypothetical protein